MATGTHDKDHTPVLMATSSVDGKTPVAVYADPDTHRLLTTSAGGSGTVTSVSVVTANGFAGTVANATTTPAITLTTTVTGILKGNGTAISAGVAGDVDPILPTQTGHSGEFLTTNGTTSSWAAVSGGGITIGTTTITSGTTTRILYDNAGVVGEYTLSGSGTVVAMQTSPQLITPNIGVATGTSLDVSGVLESGANGATGGQLKMFGSTSGDVTLKVAAAAGTATVFQLPADNGTNTYVLQTNGSGITSWVAPASGGTPSAPPDSIQFNNAGSFGGSATLLFNGTDTITFGAEASVATIQGADATTSDTVGGSISIVGGAGLGTEQGGEINLIAGRGGATGVGADALFSAGAGGATSGDGGDAIIRSGDSESNSDAGNVVLSLGEGDAGGGDGLVYITPRSTSFSAILNPYTIDTSDKTFTFPNASGTFALTSGGALDLRVGTTTVSNGTSTRILYDNAGVLGEYTLTGSGTVVAMQTAPTFVTSITTPAVLATANDSGAIGASGTAFSDLFLASGAVINFAAGNATITHASGLLTIGGSGAVTLALGTNSLTMTGSLAATGARVTKGWFTDIESTNMITINGTSLASATVTFTNKRITPRVLSAAAYTTDTGSSINGDTQDMFIVTAQTGALKFNNPSGTPTDGQKLIITVASSTTSARALTWDTAYGSTTVTLPTTTAATTATLSIGFIWSASKSLWQCVAVA